MRSPATSTLAVLLVATSAHAEITISGTKTQVTTNPAPQFDPSISGDIVVYTDRRDRNDDIYYTNLATGAEVAVATNPHEQRLHDVDEGRIVYTDLSGVEPQVFSYDIATGASAAIFEQPTFRQLEPTVDGAIVAFEIYAPPFGNADVAVADLEAGTYTVITSTAEHEGRPTVGSTFVVFERGSAPLAADSEIVLYDLVSETETVLGPGLEPHTDGRRVAWRSGPTAEADIVVVDTTTGAMTTVAYPGPQTRARLAGDVLAFDDESLGDPDVVLLHLPSGVTHRVAGAAGTAEFLNDIDGNRLVYTSTETGNFDIFLFELTIEGLEQQPPPPPPPPAPLTEDPCADTSGLVEVFSDELGRERGAPYTESATFAAPSFGAGDGVIVVENDGCASAVVTLNAEVVFTPDDFNAELQCSYQWLSLQDENALEVELRSQPGCSVRVTVYAVEPVPMDIVTASASVALVDDGADDEADDDAIRTLPGELTCDTSSAGGSAPIAALALFVLALGRRRRR